MQEFRTQAIDWYQENGDRLTEWLESNYLDQLAELQTGYPEDTSRLVVDWFDVFRFDPDFADDAIAQTEIIQDIFKQALRDYDKGADVNLSGADIHFKNVDEPLEIPDVQAEGEFVGELVTIRGQVAKSSAIKPALTEAHLRCDSCGYEFDVKQPVHGVKRPGSCPGTDCRGSEFTPDMDNSTFEKQQLIRVKEPPEEADGDESLDVYLRGDATGTATVGDRADVTGVLKADFNGFDTKIPELYMVGHAVEMHSSDYEDIDVSEEKEEFEALASGVRGNPYELLIDSIAPSITGGNKMDAIKLGIALQLFGGWRRPTNDGRYVRGDMHMAIIGAPGTGKSSLLEAAQKLSPRSGFVSGKNATQAGLTAAAVRDDFGDTEWSLEAGAVVKAHKGLCCIDEIDKVDGDALSSLHTALEKQRLEFNKAGIDASLRCETSILAGGNPENGHFLDEYGVIEQLNLGPTLRSRFDLIFTLADNADKEGDMNKSMHAQKMRQLSALVDKGENPEERDLMEMAVPRDTLRAWIAYARENVFPVVRKDEHLQRISDWYTTHRNEAENKMNLRSVDGIHRFAEASARVRLSDTVEDEDIDRVINLLEMSLDDLGLMDGGDWGEFETGVSDEIREMKASVKGILEELMPDAQTGVDKEELVEMCVSAGHDERQVRQEIRKLRDNAIVTTDATDDKVRSLDY